MICSVYKPGWWIWYKLWSKVWTAGPSQADNRLQVSVGRWQAHCCNGYNSSFICRKLDDSSSGARSWCFEAPLVSSVVLMVVEVFLFSDLCACVLQRSADRLNVFISIVQTQSSAHGEIVWMKTCLCFPPCSLNASFMRLMFCLLPVCSNHCRLCCRMIFSCWRFICFLFVSVQLFFCTLTVWAVGVKRTVSPTLVFKLQLRCGSSM